MITPLFVGEMVALGWCLGVLSCCLVFLIVWWRRQDGKR